MDTAPPRDRADAVLRQVEANLVAVRRGEFERLVLARDWALLHQVDAELAR